MLPLTRSRNRARFFGTPFSPEALFAGGTVAGAWYDPSDLTTLFTTSAGTTPVAMPGGGSAVVVGRMLDKSGNGNHAIAFNDTTARPELRARVNLLTYSEEFGNAAWTKNSITVTQNAAVAPNGTTTADKLAANIGSTSWWAIQSITAIASASGIVYAKASGWNFVSVGRGFVYGSGDYAIFDLQNGTVTRSPTFGGSTANITSVGNGWYRCQLLSPQSSGDYHVAPQGTGTAVNSGTPNGSDGVLVWGADLRPANIGANVPAYQRIADANTYDTAGFPLYLRFDGIDDSMYTPANLNLSGTDKVAVFAGVRKLSDATFGQIAELSIEATPNPGTFIMRAPQGAPAANYGFLHRGSVTMADATTPSSYTAPITSVLSGLSNLGGPSVSMRVNGVQAASSTGLVGAGNYGTYPLFIGSRGNNQLWLNGHLYSLIIAGSAVSAGNISATEQWVAQRTGIVIP